MHRDDTQHRFDEWWKLREHLLKDGMKKSDIIRRASQGIDPPSKSENTHFYTRLVVSQIERERRALLNPLDRYKREIEKDGGYFASVTIRIILFFLVGLFIALVLVWPITQYDVANNQNSTWVGVLVYIILCVIVGSLTASRSEQKRISGIIHKAYEDGAIDESHNHCAEAYKKAIEEVEQNAKSKRAS